MNAFGLQQVAKVRGDQLAGLLVALDRVLEDGHLQAGLLRRLEQVLRHRRDAGATGAHAGLVGHEGEGLGGGGVDHVRGRDPEPPAELGELVDECDVDQAERVLEQLGGLCDLRRFDRVDGYPSGRIELHRGVQRLLARRPGNPRDLAQLGAPPRIEPLRHMRDEGAHSPQTPGKVAREPDGDRAGEDDQPFGSRQQTGVLDEAVEGPHAELEPGPEVGETQDEDVARREVAEVGGGLARGFGRSRLLPDRVDPTFVHVIADGFVTGPLPEGHLLRSDRAESDDSDSRVRFQRTCIRYQERLLP